MLVKKFGGTSVGSIERIQAVAERLARDFLRGERPVVVVSAMSGETNRLVDLGNKIDSSNRGPAYDMLVASGEQVSVALLCIALEKLGFKAKPFLGFQLGIETDSVASKARILRIRTEDLRKAADEQMIPVVAGFQGVDEFNNITTLGRGGSDTTAVALAAALGEKECEIYTDVPAIYTSDPRLVPKAKEISKLSFEEMMEMAALGSKVLQVRSVEIGAKYNVRIHLRSTFAERVGTWIVPEGEILENAVVSSVTHDPSTVIFKLHPMPSGVQFLADLFSNLAEKGVAVDIITQSESAEGQRLAFSTTEEDRPIAERVMKSVIEKWQPQFNSKMELEIIRDMCKVSVVGLGMQNHPGVAARFFKTLSDKQVKIHLVTTSEIKISVVVDKTQLSEVAQSLHTEFGLDQA